MKQAFVKLSQSVNGLAAVGDLVLAQDNSGAWKSHYIFDRDGNLTDDEDWNYYSRAYAWNEKYNRVFFFRDHTSPNDLMYEDIDQNTINKHVNLRVIIALGLIAHKSIISALNLIK